MSEINSIVKSFEAAKPEPTHKDTCVQIGCHFEEVAEMFEALEMKYDEHEMKNVANFFKLCRQMQLDYIKDCDRKALLDALCDQIVTAIGVATFLGMDIESALAEVNASNWSKFVDGKAVLDENGKIAKPDTYFKPNLEPFVGEMPWKK